MNKLWREEDKQRFEAFKELMKEDAMESRSVTIKHMRYGIVEGVQEIDQPRKEKGWSKIINSVECYYYESRGWRVKINSKIDVTGEVELEKNDDGWTIFRLNEKDADMSPDVTFTKAQGVVIPAGMTWKDWLDKHYRNNPYTLDDVVSKHTTTVIQVWKEGA